MRHPLIPLIVALLVLGAAAPVAAASVDPRFEVLVTDPTLDPGQETTITVQLLNDAADADDVADTAKNVEVSLSGGDSPVPVESGSRFIGDLADGTPQQLTFQVTVPPDAPPGDYTLELEIRYEFEDETKRKTVNVPVTVSSVARFDDRSADTNVSIGETGPLTVTLENVGSAVAHEATVVLETADAGLTFAGGARYETFVGRWGAGETRTVETDLSVADSARLRNYSLSATISYEDEGGRQRSRAIAMTVRPEPRQSFEVVRVDTTAPVAGTGVLNLTLRNTGPNTAYASTVTVASSDADLTFAGGTPEAQSAAGDWRPGEVRSLTYRLHVSDQALVRDYPLRATVRYEDADGIDRRPRTVPVAVRPVPEQSFNLTEVESTLAVGDEGAVRGVVRNTGETAVRNAVVVLSTDNANVVPIETEFAVGDIAPGGTASFAFDAEITDSADAGPRQLSFVIRYRDAEDDVHRSDPLDARVEVGPRADTFTVEPVRPRFSPGSSGVLELRVTNEGDAAVSDVSAKLFADGPLSSSDDEAFIDRLGPGETSTIRFSIAVAGDAVEQKVYPVSLDFQYEDAEGDTELSNSYDVPVQVTVRPDRGPSLPLIVGAVVLVVLAVGAGLWYRRR